jgi:hypothetical protein
MQTTPSTRKIVEEVRSILEANPDIQEVSVGPVTPIAQEKNSSAVYIGVEEVGAEPARLSKGSSGYDRHLLINLYCNYDGSEDTLGVYDFIDSVERCILTDNEIWSSIVDRDLVAIDYDQQEHTPRRAVRMLFDFTFRLAC